MVDPFMTNLSLGWTLLAAGVISALVIATYKSSYATDPAPGAAKRGKPGQDLKPITRWCFVALSIVLASYGALRIQRDHNWSIFQRPHLNAGEINTK